MQVWSEVMYYVGVEWGYVLCRYGLKFCIMQVWIKVMYYVGME